MLEYSNKYNNRLKKLVFIGGSYKMPVNQDLIDLAETKPLIIDPNSSLIFVIKKLSKFVGESIPIVDKKNHKMIGIISENDVLKAYLDIAEEINLIEKH